MQFDFTSIMERKGKDATALDGLGKRPGFAPDAPKEGVDPIPMWVADMNFPTAPGIVEAIRQRLDHPAFGYFMPREEYFNGIIHWHEKRNGVTGLAPEHIGYENGVLGGVVSTVCAFTAPGDPILVHSPTYIGFTNSLNNTGRKLIHSPLVKDEQGVWRMDYEDMEAKLRDNNIHMAVFCNPHNPCGRVWERWELERAMELFAKYDCVVASDEIWSDIILPGHKHIPLQSISEDARRRTAAFYALSKTFNLAGLVGSYHIIYDKYLRDRIVAYSTKGHYNSMNMLSMYALIGAYTDEGEAWLDELCQVIDGNVEYVSNFIKEHFQGVSTFRAQGTYMLFVDCKEWLEAHGKTLKDLEKACWDVGVMIQDGKMFHGEGCIRMNLALPLSRVKEAMDRLDKYVFNA